MQRLFYFGIRMHRNGWKVGLLVTKSLCNVYTLNVDSVDILISASDGGGVIIIIITLIQEDNIFGTDASLTYGPPLTDIDMLLKQGTYNHIIIYSMYRVDALRTPSRLRAGYPTLLQWRGRYDFSRLKTSP